MLSFFWQFHNIFKQIIPSNELFSSMNGSLLHCEFCTGWKYRFDWE